MLRRTESPIKRIFFPWSNVRAFFFWKMSITAIWKKLGFTLKFLKMPFPSPHDILPNGLLIMRKWGRRYCFPFTSLLSHVMFFLIALIFPPPLNILPHQTWLSPPPLGDLGLGSRSGSRRLCLPAAKGPLTQILGKVMVCGGVRFFRTEPFHC